MNLLKRLIVDAQAAGRAHPGSPDSLVIAVSAVLEGMSLIALHEPEKFRKSCPVPDIILRMLIPHRFSARGVKK